MSGSKLQFLLVMKSDEEKLFIHLHPPASLEHTSPGILFFIPLLSSNLPSAHRIFIIAFTTFLNPPTHDDKI